MAPEVGRAIFDNRNQSFALVEEQKMQFRRSKSLNSIENSYPLKKRTARTIADAVNEVPNNTAGIIFPKRPRSYSGGRMSRGEENCGGNEILNEE